MDEDVKAIERWLDGRSDELKYAILRNGKNAVSHFLEKDIDLFWDDKETINDMLDEAIMALSQDQFDDWCYFLGVA